VIAVEASRNYSWLVDEMEQAGHRPKLCNPLEAKRRMGLTHTKRISSMRAGWRFYFATARCRKSGFLLGL
jgi:hypothetical protein